MNLIRLARHTGIRYTAAMTSILFICHGNICRSPMTEFIFRNMLVQRGLTEHFSCASAATSREEIGSDIHDGTRRILRYHKIPFTARCARQVRPDDYADYNLLIGMDRANCSNTLRIVGTDPLQKIHALLDYTEDPRDIADPWYTGNFEVTYADIVEGCTALLNTRLALQEI